ncbi:MAG: hypothetical protein PHY48_03580 [Candidatus Cloacimonetes bacterium]|nr:hypothetical protein [Candidatus Cloacimonadota bacterium]
MGTQQILLIVLSVVIVGVAIAVGISMFNSQSYNSNKTAIAADAQSFATQVVQYYKTPVSQGGGGNLLPTADAAGALVVGNAIGWGDITTTNDNGTYTLAITTAGASGVATITGVGTAAKAGGEKPNVVTTIALPAGTITAVATDV